MNMMKLMKQAQQMQAKAAQMQAELGAKQFEASAGGGVVKAVATGDGQVTSIKIDPTILKEGDVEMIEELVLTAVREALETGRKEMQKEMGKLTAGMGLPPGLM
jgi:DNA-binding YbaB/EbfC family protein